MIKRAIRYLRISTDKQSNYSISGQDMQTKAWCERNNIYVVDTFTDEGYSARTFDRPDMHRLYEFIGKHYKTVDYLVVNDFTRFSRDTGEALIEVKKLQKKYQIKIASAGEGVIVDYDDPGSFFYAGLRFLQGEDEINRNRARVNLGIYTAKKKEGRYLGKPPVGYVTVKDGRKTIIVPDEEKAHIIRYIFDAYMVNTPVVDISRRAFEMGLKQRGKSHIQYILKNFVYTGMIKVKAYKDNPEELVEGIHEPIISRYKWLQVQDKMNPPKIVHILSDDFPLRSVLLCHCGKPLTGAPSRGRSGKYWPYYKCKIAGHNNFNANKAHEQMLQIMKLLSLSDKLIAATRNVATEMMDTQLRQNTETLRQKKQELQHAETMLISVEKKWIEDEIEHESYQRWYNDLTKKRIKLRAEIENLSQSKNNLNVLLHSELDKLSNLQDIYFNASTIEKQQFIRLLFDNQLYYQDHMYRTSYMLPLFEHNLLILKEKKLLIVERKRRNLENSSSSAAPRSAIEPLEQLLSFVSRIQVA